LTTLAFAGSAFATDVEVLHWWTSGGEAKSVGQLQQIVKKAAMAGKTSPWLAAVAKRAATALKTRVISGNPPTAAQIKGPRSRNGAPKACWPISMPPPFRGWDAVPPKVVADIMKYKGHYVAAPSTCTASTGCG
jgi:glucose/mannose transport system substrate-binding protein